MELWSFKSCDFGGDFDDFGPCAESNDNHCCEGAVCLSQPTESHPGGKSNRVTMNAHRVADTLLVILSKNNAAIIVDYFNLFEYSIQKTGRSLLFGCWHGYGLWKGKGWLPVDGTLLEASLSSH